MSESCEHTVKDARSYLECPGCRGVVIAMDQTSGPIRFDDINGLLKEIRQQAKRMRKQVR